MTMRMRQSLTGAVVQDGAVPGVLPDEFRLQQPGALLQRAGGRPRLARPERERQGEPLLLRGPGGRPQHRPKAGGPAGEYMPSHGLANLQQPWPAVYEACTEACCDETCDRSNMTTPRCLGLAVCLVKTAPAVGILVSCHPQDAPVQSI